MLKIKDNICLKELENFGFKKEGGTLEEHYYHYKYTKFKRTLFSTYEIIIDININRRISIIELTSPIWTDKEYYDNPTVCRNGYDVTAFKKRYIKDLIKAGLVEEASDEMSNFTEKIIDKELKKEIQRVFGNKEKNYSESMQILSEEDTLNILNNTITEFKHYQHSNIPQPVTISLEIQALESLLKYYKQEKEKNKELLHEKELNQKAINIANYQLCNYDMGYQAGLHKEITATEIVVKEMENFIIGKKIKRLEDTIYELYKKLDEGNKIVEQDYISKDRIRKLRENFCKNLVIRGSGRSNRKTFYQAVLNEINKFIDKLLEEEKNG